MSLLRTMAMFSGQILLDTLLSYRLSWSMVARCLWLLFVTTVRACMGPSLLASLVCSARVWGVVLGALQARALLNSASD